MKSRNFTVTSTSSEVIAAEPSTRQVYLHVLGNGVVYIGGADVTTTNGLLTEKAAAPQPLTIPPGENLFAVTAVGVTEELRVLVQGD
jgi:hypothetical protein